MKISLWERYFTKEIGIELKACLYFFAFLFYYCCYRLYLGMTVAEILHMAEMILATYVMGYVQLFFLWNFDEADSVGIKEVAAILGCSIVYGGLAYVCNWFDKRIPVTVGFWGYVIFMYICVIIIYKYRRKIDDKILNADLEHFKAWKEETEERSE